VVADIPGLIEGAADGAGIGDRFLGHIERTRVLLHLVDCQDEDVATSYRVVRDELNNYGAGLEDKAVVLALNKVDTIDAELVEALSDELREESGLPVFALSAAAEQGLQTVLDALAEHLDGRAARDEEEAAEADGSEPAKSWSPL
jgi:GTP-binding protein